MSGEWHAPYSARNDYPAYCEAAGMEHAPIERTPPLTVIYLPPVAGRFASSLAPERDRAPRATRGVSWPSCVRWWLVVGLLSGVCWGALALVVWLVAGWLGVW